MTGARGAFFHRAFQEQFCKQKETILFGDLGGEVKDDGKEGSPPSPAPAGTWVHGSEVSLRLTVNF